MPENGLLSDVKSREKTILALRKCLLTYEVWGVLGIDDDGVALASPVAFETSKPFFYVRTDDISGRRVLNAPVPELRGKNLSVVADQIRDVAIVKTARELIRAVGADFSRVFVRVTPSAEVSAELTKMGLACVCFIV